MTECGRSILICNGKLFYVWNLGKDLEIYLILEYEVMNMQRLQDTILYNVLIQRESNDAKYYASFLLPLEKDMDVLLQYIKRLFPEFPDHGLQHSLRIIEYVGNLISEKQINEMSSLEIVVFIFASLFHDSGMVLYNSKETEDIREKHHYFAEQIITLYFDENLNQLSEKERIKDAISFVCYAHGISLEELCADERFLRIDNIYYEKVRYGLLAFLLRIGDLMDLEGERVNNFRMHIFSKEFSKTAFDHNKRHQNVKLYYYDSNMITIEVEAENIQQYKIWYDWFDYLQKDILTANTYLKQDGYYFPYPKTKIRKTDGAEFDVQELRFEIDEKGGIWEIISKSIYTNELDFVRELVQNSIDAILKKIFLNPAFNLDIVSPRSWGVSTVSDPVLVCYSENQKKLYVIDHGIGMDEQDLKNFLFKVSSTGSVHCAERKFEFPGIAKYGIGFVSCLINADNIEVYTSKQKDPKIHQVTLEANLNVAFIQNSSNVIDFTGTVVVLQLKRVFLVKTIENYLRNTFCYPSIDIKFVDLDRIKGVAEQFSDKEKYISALERPYMLYDYVLNLKSRADYIANPVNDKRKRLLEFEMKFEYLENFFKTEYVCILDSQKRKEYNIKVDNLKKEIPSEKLKDAFPDVKLDFTGTVSEDEEEKLYYILKDAFDEYRREMVIERGKFDTILDKYEIKIDTINLKQINMGGDWQYFVVFFDSDFEIYKLKCSKEPIDISRGTGIILFKHRGCDYQNGIEYAAINGFLFQNGQTHNRLVRLKKYSESYYPKDTPDSFVIGLEEKYDIREQIEEYLEYYGDRDDEFTAYIEETGGRFETEYDEIYINDNQFVRINNEDVFKTISPLINLNDKVEEHIYLYHDIASRDVNEPEDIMEVNLLELRDSIHTKQNSYYQDGIAIPSNLNPLFPIGFFKIVCNCTADARMKLNVTRHEPSAIRTDVEEWVNNTGKKIQKMIYNSLQKMLIEEKLEIEFENLFNQNNDADYFEQICFNSLKDELRHL